MCIICIPPSGGDILFSSCPFVDHIFFFKYFVWINPCLIIEIALLCCLKKIGGSWATHGLYLELPVPNILSYPCPISWVTLVLFLELPMAYIFNYPCSPSWVTWVLYLELPVSYILSYMFPMSWVTYVLYLALPLFNILSYLCPISWVTCVLYHELPVSYILSYLFIVFLYCMWRGSGQFKLMQIKIILLCHINFLRSSIKIFSGWCLVFNHFYSCHILVHVHDWFV